MRDSDSMPESILGALSYRSASGPVRLVRRLEPALDVE